jgi:DNA-binding transcriptional MerR regulator
MEHFPIREVAEITGVNPVTLRAWQRRHGLIKPKRTQQGHRLYSLKDIDTIKAILVWLEKGVAIRNVKTLLDKPQATRQEQSLPEVRDVLTALAKLDLNKASQLLSASLTDYPINSFKNGFFLPLEQQLKQRQRPYQGIQYSAWRTLFTETMSVRVSQLRKYNKKSCWLIRCGQRGHTLAWLTAYELSCQGYSPNMLDGIQDNLSPFHKLITTQKTTKVVVVGEQKIPIGIIKELQQLPDKPKLVGSIASIHQQDFR